MNHSLNLKLIAIVIVVSLAFLSSCRQSSGTITPTIATTYTPYPTQTLLVLPTITQTPKPSFSPIVTTKSAPTPTPTSAPTSSIISYPAKQPVVIFGSEMNTQDTGPFLERGAFILEPRLLLYQDGQLIIKDDEGQLQEKR